MLVLTRKENEGVVIGGGIKVTVLDVQGGKIRLGIEAPRGVPIRRGELLEAEPKAVVIGPLALPRDAALAALAQ